MVPTYCTSHISNMKACGSRVKVMKISFSSSTSLSFFVCFLKTQHYLLPKTMEEGLSHVEIQKAPSRFKQPILYRWVKSALHVGWQYVLHFSIKHHAIFSQHRLLHSISCSFQAKTERQEPGFCTGIEISYTGKNKQMVLICIPELCLFR